jgi:hypothetical protein
MKPRLLIVVILTLLFASVSLLPNSTQAMTDCIDTEHLTCPSNYVAFGVCPETGQVVHLHWDTAHQIYIRMPTF